MDWCDDTRRVEFAENKDAENVCFDRYDDQKWMRKIFAKSIFLLHHDSLANNDKMNEWMMTTMTISSVA